MLKISVPATAANLGAGIDCIGIALNLYNHFYLISTDEKKPAPAIPLKGNSLFHRAFRLVAGKTRRTCPPTNVFLEMGVPVSRGLGSSATLTVAGLVAANALLEAGLNEQELLLLAAELEGHPDNAAPALLGGLVLAVTTNTGIVYRRIGVPSALQAVVAVPDFKLPTRIARQALPKEVPLADAIKNLGRFGLFLTSIMSGDYRDLSQAMEDSLHQPYRLALVPGMKEVMAAALESGARGSCLSGAGPTILAFADQRQEDIAAKMKAKWREFQVGCEVYVLDVAASGATVSPLL